MSDEVFIGFIEDYEKYQEEQGAKASGANEDKNVRKIAYDNMDPISDEDLKLLQSTITRHDYDTVFMQSRLDYYDDYYHEDPDSYESLLAEVKKIRRVYINYQDFLKALDLIDRYYDSLVEKYGGEEMFDVYYRSGLITDWIPPQPQLSKRSKDYERYMNGDMWSSDGDYDFDKLHDALDNMVKDLNIDPLTIGIRGDVQTSPIVLRNANYSTKVETGGRYSNNINGVSTNDLNELQEMFRGWYREDIETPGVKLDKSTWFCNTPEAIRAQYFTQPIVYMDSKFTEPIVESERDPNEMVIDPELNRPMTRSEYDQRKFVRMLRDSGWSELRMMRYLGVGSKYEQKLMFLKHKNKKKAKKKANDLIRSIIGNDQTELQFFNSTDELRGVLFDDD